MKWPPSVLGILLVLEQFCLSLLLLFSLLWFYFCIYLPLLLFFITIIIKIISSIIVVTLLFVVVIVYSITVVDFIFYYHCHYLCVRTSPTMTMIMHCPNRMLYPNVHTNSNHADYNRRLSSRSFQRSEGDSHSRLMLLCSLVYLYIICVFIYIYRERMRPMFEIW